MDSIQHDLPLDVLPLDTTVDDLGLAYEPLSLPTRAFAWLIYTDAGALSIRLVIALGAAWLFAAGDVVSFALLALALCLASIALEV